MNGVVALKRAKDYVDETIQGFGAIKGKDGISPTIKENQNNDDNTYKLDIKDINGDKTTPNLKGKDGIDGFSPVVLPNLNNTTDEYRLDITTKNGKISTVNLKGKQGIQGKDGYPFLIYKEYKSLDEFQASDFPEIGLLFLLTGENEEEYSSFPVYRYTGNEETPYSYITSLNSTESIKGDAGKTYTPEIGDVVSGNHADVDIRVDEENSKAIFDFILPKGEKGDPAENDYNYAKNKPSINEVTINGNLTLEDLGIQPSGEYLTTIPISNTETIGGIKPDGITTKVDENGILSAIVGDEGSGQYGKDGKSAYQIAQDNGFQGTEEQWLESLKGQDGKTYTPTIGNVKSGDSPEVSVNIEESNVKFDFTLPKGKDGRSITSVRTDENNNFYVTFSDGKEELVGQLNFDVQADFLTSGGFGNLRYYQGKLQYYNGVNWIETSVTPDNVYIINMNPQPMQFIMGIYDKQINHYKLKFVEPKDTLIDGQVACLVESVTIRRKKGSIPKNETDGQLVTIIPRSDFGLHGENWYIDEDLTPNMDDIYYYKAFPMSTAGFYNASNANATIGIKAKDYELYGFRINQNESDPNSMITYIKDNAQFRSAYMDFNTGKFYYGDWRYLEDVFFMHFKPCMLKYDGTVGYYLNPDDYTKKLNSDEDSDVSNADYEGNAMVEFPKIYWKIVDNGDNTADILISNKKVDEGFHCWSHIDANNNEISYCYMPIYNGSNVNSILRSISNRTIMTNQTVNTEVTRALANNKDENIIWYTEVYSDRVLIMLLLFLLGKSTNVQSVYGRGRGNADSAITTTGNLNTGGLFYGTNTNINSIKVFGMEHLWGNYWRRIAGWICDKGTHRVKMTYGQADGSETVGYNTIGDGYIEIHDSKPIGTSANYLTGAILSEQGFIPKNVASSGSASTYYGDTYSYDNSVVAYARVGGVYNSTSVFDNGIFRVIMVSKASESISTNNASISCKPLSKEV